MNIKKVIKAHGFTMKSVADSLGITLAALSQIASGNPSAKRLQEIADILGCSVSEFFNDGDSLNFVALVKSGNKYYCASSLNELEEVINKLKKGGE